MEPKAIENTFAYENYTFLFDVLNGQFRVVPITDVTETVTSFSFEEDPIFLKMDPGTRKVVVSRSVEVDPTEEKRQFVLSNLQNFAGVTVDTTFNGVDERSILAAGGIGVTDLMDTDPVDFDYLNFDFNRTYIFNQDGTGSPFRIASVEILKVPMVNVEWNFKVNGVPQAITRDLSKRFGLVFTVRFVLFS